MNIGNATLALSIMSQTSQGGFDFASLYSGSSGGATSAYGVASVGVALQNAEKNEAKQLADIANQPDIARDLARYEKVLREAESFEDVLDDPVARKVLMKANGLGDQVDYVGMAKKALMSDPTDPKSVAAQLSGVNSSWLEFAKTYNIAKNGLEKLYTKQDGYEGRWNVTIERDGKPQVAELQITKVRGGWQGTFDGKPVPIEIKDGVLKTSFLWEDAEEAVHLTRLEGKLGRDGLLSGKQFDDGVEASKKWATEFANSGGLETIKKNYIAESRLDMLDQQLPGLGTAVLFKKQAATLDNTVKILGSAIGREVITTAFGIPKQIALQSIEAQEKAINQRMDPLKLKNPAYVEKVVQRYLIQLNGGTGGLTV